MHVLRFGNKLNEEVCCGFIFANLFNSLYLLVRLWWNILVANLATNFQDLVAKVKNLVALAPVLGAISCPATMLAKPLGIHPHVYVSTWSVIGPLTFSDIYIILHNVALFVLMSDLTSWITLPQLFNLKSKKLPTFNRRNLHLITNFIMLIKHLPSKYMHCSVSIVCLVQSAFCYTL